MCVVSMVMEHYGDKWSKLTPSPPYIPSVFPLAPATIVAPITPEEIVEFRALLERARQYDHEHNQPDCELAEKQERLRKIAESLGVPIRFD